MRMLRRVTAWIFVLLCCAASLAEAGDERRKADLEPVLRLLASPVAADRKAAQTKLFEIKDLDRTDAALKSRVDSLTDPLRFPALLALAMTRHVLHQGDTNPAVPGLVAALRAAHDPATQIAILETLGYCQGEARPAAAEVEHYMDGEPGTSVQQMYNVA